MFHRWKYAKFFNANIFCIDDPMYGLSEYTVVKWYYGDKNVSYLKLMVPIIQKVIKQLNIDIKNVTFIGSSGGGYAAIYLANIVDGTTAIALNPQYNLGNFVPSCNKIFLEEHGIDLCSDDIHCRNILNITSTKSLFVLVTNYLSSKDYDIQFKQFCERHNLSPRYGIEQKDNFITYIHASDGHNPHTCNPEKEYLTMLLMIARAWHEGKNINWLNPISILIGESLNDKFELQKNVHNKNNQLEFIKGILNIKFTCKSFHKKHLSYDIENNLYIQSNINKIVVHINKGQVSFFVNNNKIDQNINYLINNDKSFSFMIDKMYLSARKDNSVSFMKQNKAWEHFFIDEILE